MNWLQILVTFREDSQLTASMNFDRSALKCACEFLKIQARGKEVR